MENKLSSMTLNWKEFNVDLEAIDAKLRADYPNNFCGNQAHGLLELYFTGELTEKMKSDIQKYWDGLTANSSAAKSYRSTADIKTALDEVKAGLISKDWNSLSQLERKMVMGQSVTKSELISADLV